MITIPAWLFQNFNGDPFHRGPHSTTSTSKFWHTQVTDSVREHFVEQLVNCQSPKESTEELIKKGREFEQQMFDVCNSREEYYRMVVKKIKQIRKQNQKKPDRYY
uniref:KIX domain-containing protein n=1 Tax=Caenorhabditis tropicalis TaxID=1561998 RepID=A0A1I7TA91_9PELO